MKFPDEYYANLEALEKAYPRYRLLNKSQMADFLGYGRKTRILHSLGITSKLTRESFAMRLANLGRKEGNDD